MKRMPDKLAYQSTLIPSHLKKALKRHTNKLTYRLMEHIDGVILKRNVDNSEFLDYVLQNAYERLVDFGVDTEGDKYMRHLTGLNMDFCRHCA
jgi:hypothetical protein